MTTLGTRVALLAGGGVALLLGLWTGLARAGVHAPFGPVGDHGVIMVLGFVGTVIALERAVADGRAWAYLGPSSSVAGVLVLLVGGPRPVAGASLTLAGVVVSASYGRLLRHRAAHHLVAAAGAGAWGLAALLWAAGLTPVEITPLLATFVVLTIVGERLELSRLGRRRGADVRRPLAAAGALAIGALTSPFHRPAGLVIAGLAMIAMVVWLARNDIVRWTVHRSGVPRFSAICLLAGYAWLAVGGILWVALGLELDLPLLHDAAVHAVFLGFVISMVMGHAPIIVPAVLRRPVAHRWWAYGPVLVLHLSLAVRVGADLGGSVWLRGLAAHGNVTALLLFTAVTVHAVLVGTPR